MRSLLIGECKFDNVYQLVDPSEFLEIDFEAEVIKALTCLFPQYACGIFAGSFVRDLERHSADLALIHRTLSHWFVVEVELASHSLEHHVIPQVRSFLYGEPEASCVISLCRAFPEMSREQALSILRHVPRSVAVISNVFDPMWHPALCALGVQMLSLSVFRNHEGRIAYEMDGQLTVVSESLGFARFSAVDNAIRLPRSCGLSLGPLRVEDEYGAVGLWTVREDGANVWITKDRGRALIDNGEQVQVLRTLEGRVCFRLSSRR